MSDAGGSTMTSSGTQPNGQFDASRGAFRVDPSVQAARSDFDAFQRQWQAQIGDGFRLPIFTPATTGDFRVKARIARLHDVAITDAYAVSRLQTGDAPGGVEDQVRLFIVRHGAWTLGGSPHHGPQTVSAGQFLLRHVGRPSPFRTAPHTRAEIVVLPALTLKPLLHDRIVTGSTDSPEVRLLAAHARMIQATIADLSPSGVRAAHSTAIELATAVAKGRFDDTEPQLAPALAQAAKDLAETHLSDPDLSAASLACALNVSLRTLQRAFAATGDSISAHIRDRRLERARLALTAPSGRPSVTELATHLQFADSSHFIRAFKKRYGCTPTEYSTTRGGASSER